ncbi:MAG TPA: 5'-nucleotidase C-terminal domain-containing protein [Gemmatimonadaceae bacterium]
MERRIVAAAAALLLSALSSAAGAQTVDIVVASTTDVHGRVRGWDYFADTAESTRGLSRVATIVDSARDANPGRVVLVDAGDFLQGNPFTYAAARIDTTLPNATIAAMNAMHYDAVTIGNHEFNYGVPALRRAITAATFPLLAANVSGGPDPAAWRPYTIVERGGVKIGVVGATTPGSMLWDAANLREARVSIGAMLPAIAKAVGAARAAGADAIVVVAHAGISGESNYDTLATGAENPLVQVAHDVPGIDLIVFGHTHREVADTTINGVLLTQPRNWAASVSLAHLVFEKSGGTWSVASKHASIVRAAGHREQAAVVAAAERGHASARTYASTVIGRTAVRWSAESARVADVPIMDFIAETMRRASGADLASAAAFSTTVRIAAGPVTVAQLAQLYPYENTLRVLRISGAQLKAYLEQSAKYFRVMGSGDVARVAADPAIPGYNFEVVTGVDYVIDLSRPPGDRITGLARHGTPVRPDDSFTVALSNYRAEGAGGYTMLRGAPLVYDRQQDIRQLLIDEVTRRGTLDPADYFTRNWSLAPAALAAKAAAGVRAERPFETATGGEARGAGRGEAGTARATTIRIISTNDFHGALEARPDGNFGMRGGAAQLAAMIRRAESECSGACASLWLDAGDEFQGTPASNLAYGRPVTDLFNALGLAASAIGNHDFDWGVDTLRARIRQAHYAMLGANIRYTDGRDVPWIRQDTVVMRGGVKIGIVGIATTLTPSTTKASNVEGLRFDDPVATVNTHAKSLRARGADLVIVVDHDGGFCNRETGCRGEIFDLAQRLTEPVDAIVSGHTHSLVTTVVKGIAIVQALSSGRAIGVIDLPVARAARAETREEVRMVKTDSITADPAIEAMLSGATQSVAPIVARPIATVAADMPRRGDQYALGNLIADAQRAAARADVAVMNNGGIRADLRAGPVSYGSLFEIQPFANMLVRVTVRGADLRAYLESFVARGAPRVHVSGVVARYDLARPPGARIVSAEVGGVPLDDGRQYTVAYTDFMATGGDGLGLAKVSLKQEPLGIVDLDALIAFMQSQPGALVRPDAAPRLAPLPL